MLKETLVGLGVLPSRYTWRNPFKIVEYGELLQGIDIRKTDVVLDLGCGSGPRIFFSPGRPPMSWASMSQSPRLPARARAASYADARNIEFFARLSKPPASDRTSSTWSSASACWSTSPSAMKCWGSSPKS